MKKLSIIIICITAAIALHAQTSPVNVVFDVTSADPATHQSTMRHVKLMSTNYPDAKFEVVLYSGSVDMALKDKSSVAEEIMNLADNDNVSFKVCAMTLKRKNISPDDLVTGFDIVPDGILEIVTRQSEGWGYIKESHH